MEIEWRLDGCGHAADAAKSSKEIVRTSGSPPRLVSAGRFEKLQQQLLRACQIELKRRRPASQVLLSVIHSAMSRLTSEAVFETLLETMTASHEVVRRGDRIGLPTGAQLSHRQRNVLNAVAAEISAAGATPLTLKELAELHKYPLKDLEPLVQIALDEGRLIRVSPLLLLDRDALESLRQKLADYFQEHPTGTVSEVREQWQMTRKHAVPILEFFDQCQITRRAGDSRSAGPRLSQSIDEVQR